MRVNILLMWSALVLAVLNYGIYAKEQIKARGEILLLELAPVDPRSLMQGDYMRLAYQIARDAPVERLAAGQQRGYLVLRADWNKVARFVRFYSGEDLASGEKLMRFHVRPGNSEQRALRLVPDSFLFQEGHAGYYQNARYGVFKFADAHDYLLTGLAAANRQPITVDDPAAAQR